MNGTQNSVRTIGFATIVVTILTAAVSFGFVRASLNDIRVHWQENLVWASSQLEIEYLRFRESLVRLGDERNGVDSAEVNRRFEILWSRVKLFQTGVAGQKMESRPHLGAAIAALQVTLEKQEPRVTGLRDNDETGASILFEAFAKHDQELYQFHRGIMQAEVEIGAGLRDALYANHLALTWLAGGAVLVTLALLAFFAAETRRQRQAAIENSILLEQARTATRAKTAFLSMMSHDLRTPMNGILGMIALAKRHTADLRQAEHLDQAADASRQMNDLLSDILDFASLDAIVSDLVAEPFELVQLQQHIRSELEPFAQREDINFTFNTTSDADQVMLGDKRRLSQIIGHLARFLGRNSATDGVELRMSYAAGFFRAEFDFHYETEAGDWHLDLVLGPSSQEISGFANDALGPAIARGFTENMGGTLSLHLPQAARENAVVVLSVPLKAQKRAYVRVRIETQSSALAAICKSALKMPHVQFYQHGDAGDVHTVVVETGAQFERDTCERLRAVYPKAKFIALGVPLDGALFDGEIKLPIDVAALRQAAFLEGIQGSLLQG
ncbi:MAG: HAMP domain-containing histidine kinase [Rhodobacteraceae bacterium]|nr:HAMP domain-containing histidine kinase [Paracoccaceae bacterium]